MITGDHGDNESNLFGIGKKKKKKKNLVWLGKWRESIGIRSILNI